LKNHWHSYVGAFGATAPPDSHGLLAQFVQIQVLFWGRGGRDGLSVNKK